MNLVTLLLLLFVTAALLQFSLLAQSSWKSLCATKFLVSNYSGYSNSFSVVLSTILFALPLFLFNHYKNLESTTYLNDVIFLIILITITIFFILLDKKVFWSKEFRKPLNPKIDLVEKIQRLKIDVDNKIEQNNQMSTSLIKRFNQKFLQTEKTTLNNKNEILTLSWKLHYINRTLQNTTLTVFKNHTKFKSELDKIKENEIEVQKKYNTTTTSVNSLSFELEKVKTKVLSQEERKLVKRNKPLAAYFNSKEQFKKFETLLHSNNFYKEHISATNLCILTCKLIDLKVLYIYRKQKHFLPTIARYFGVEEFHESTYSRIQKEFKEYNNGELIDEAHKEFYKKLSFLNSLK